MNDVTTNGMLPSAADSMGDNGARLNSDNEEASSVISAEALSAKVDELSERVGQLYNRANTRVTRRVDPIPFAGGCGGGFWFRGRLCSRLLRARRSLTPLMSGTVAS